MDPFFLAVVSYAVKDINVIRKGGLCLQLCLSLCDVSIGSSAFEIEIKMDEDLVLLKSCFVVLVRGVLRVENCCVDYESEA